MLQILKKFKPTDYIILFLIILVLIFGFLALGKKNFSDLPVEKETDIVFDVFFRGISISAKEAPFKVGDEAFITIRNVPYTKLKIVAIAGHPRMTYVNAKNNKGYEIVEDVSYPGLYDFIVRLEDRAKLTNDGYVVGGNKIKMGVPVVIEGKLYRYQGSVSNVLEVSQEQNSEQDQQQL